MSSTTSTVNVMVIMPVITSNAYIIFCGKQLLQWYVCDGWSAWTTTSRRIRAPKGSSLSRLHRNINILPSTHSKRAPLLLINYTRFPTYSISVLLYQVVTSLVRLRMFIISFLNIILSVIKYSLTLQYQKGQFICSPIGYLKG